VIGLVLLRGIDMQRGHQAALSFSQPDHQTGVATP
jgi:hypothetical protein